MSCEQRTVTLTEALARVAEGEELPEGYTLSDATADLGALAIADVAAQQELAASIVAGAANAEELTLETTYSLNDTLANLAAADAEVIAGAESYSLSEVTFTAEVVESDVAGLAEAVEAAETGFFTEDEQAVIEGAANAEEVAVTVPYTLADTLDNLAAAEEGTVGNAESYTLTNETGDLGLLNAAQIALVQGAVDVGDYTFTDADALNEALEELAAAQDAQADALNDLNDALEEAELDPVVATEAGAQSAVIQAEDALASLEASLAVERAKTAADVANASLSEFLDANVRVSDENLNRAAELAQEAVDDSETLYTITGVDVSTLEAVYRVSDDALVPGSADTPVYITDAYADVAQVSAQAFTLGTLDSGDTRTITITVGEEEIVFTSEFDGADWSDFTNSDGNTDYTFDDNDPTGVQITGPEGQSFVVSASVAAAGDNDDLEAGETEVTTPAFDTANFIESNEPLGYAANTDVTLGEVDEANIEIDVATAGQRQADWVAAQAAVRADLAKGTDVEIVTDVRDALIDYAAAGGDLTVEVGGGVSIALLLTQINAQVGKASPDVSALKAAIAGYELDADEPTEAQQAIIDAFSVVNNRVELEAAESDAGAAFAATDEGEDLLAIEALVDARGELVQDVIDAGNALTDITELAGELVAAIGRVTEAQEAVDEFGFDVQALDAGVETATEEADLFLFDLDVFDGASAINGLETGDAIFMAHFTGGGDVEAGDNDMLEFFVTTEGGNMSTPVEI